MTSTGADAHRLRELMLLRQVRDRMDREYAQPLDVAALMSQRRVPQFYRNAFGNDPAYWAATSPLAQLRRDALPMQLVCSRTRRFPTSPCDEARTFASKAATLGVAMQVLPEPLDHGQINHDLGAPSAYTDAVAAYVDALLR